MSEYESISGAPMLLAEGAASEDPTISGSWNNGATSNYVTVLWTYNPSTQLGGITGQDWPGDLETSVPPVLNGEGTAQQISAAVDDLVANYVGGLFWTTGAWDKFRDDYSIHGCVIGQNH